MQSLKILIAILLIASIQCRVIIESDTQGEIIQDGSAVVPSNFPYGKTFPASSSANWIWAKNFRSVPNGEIRTFVEEFEIYCDEPIVLSATADNKFEAFINGVSVLNGSDWTKVFSSKVYPKDLKVCGKNTLKIVAKNFHSGSPAALKYAITQDEKCLAAPPGLLFDFKTCQYTCAPSCECSSPRKWYGAPSCRCGCSQVYDCDRKGFYFSQETCTCERRPQICPDRYSWNGKIGECECVRRSCPKGFIWIEKSCDCILLQSIVTRNYGKGGNLVVGIKP